MENEELETIDSQNDEPENTDSENSESDDTEDNKPEYTEREKQYYARMKKLEEELKEAKKVAPKKENTGELSTLDIIALSKANIEDEDLDDVLDYAKYKKTSVREALKSSILKSTLAEKAEMRKSAQAVNTGSTRKASGQVSDERLLADARKGMLPDSESDIAKLARLRFQNK